MPEEAVRAGGEPLTMRLWKGNSFADLKANQGALRHQLAPQIIQNVLLHSEMALLFLNRMVCILESIMEAEVEHFPREAPAPRWTRRRRQLTKAILDSGHRLAPREGTTGRVRMVCLRCLSVRRQGQGLLPWLRARPCPGTPLARGRPIAVCPLADSSHHLELHGEIVICRRCGCYAGYGSGIRKLRNPCTGRPARRMAENYRQLWRGRHPHGQPLRELGVETLLQLDCLTA